MIRRALVLCVCVFVVAVCAQGQVAEEFEKIIVQERLRTGTPGVAVALVKDDRVVFAKAFGVANLETETPMSTDTLCRSGPITSVFTAAALIMLQEQGKIKLEQPVGKYVSGLNANSRL